MEVSLLTHQFKSKDRDKIWLLEKDSKRLLKDFLYSPELKFDGSSSECYSDITKLTKLFHKHKINPI